VRDEALPKSWVNPPIGDCCDLNPKIDKSQFDPASKIREGLTKRERTKMETTQSRYARRYDREFKENAVALVESGREVKEVARDLGVSHWSLKNWCKQSQAGKEQTQVGTLDGESSLQREVRRMRQEIDYLRRQRDILKKALGIVSADVPGSALR
jgi:transposase-like protein